MLKLGLCAPLRLLVSESRLVTYDVVTGAARGAHRNTAPTVSVENLTARWRTANATTVDIA